MPRRSKSIVMAMAMAMAMAMVVTMGKSGRGSSRSSRKCLRLARHRWLAPRILPAPERTSSRSHAHRRSPRQQGGYRRLPDNTQIGPGPLGTKGPNPWYLLACVCTEQRNPPRARPTLPVARGCLPTPHCSTLPPESQAAEPARRRLCARPWRRPAASRAPTRC